MCKDGFYFFTNYRNIAKDLPVELRAEFYEALMDYAIDGIEPENGIIKALITAIKPSLDKTEKRGGNHNPTGQNQYKEVKVGQSEVKSGQNEVKVGQSGQSFIKQETRNIKQEINNNISFGKPQDIFVKNEAFDISKINEVLENYGLAKIRDLTEERKTKLKQRCLSVGGFDNFLGYLRVALGESSFLRGDNKQGWKADFDFFLQKSSWQKLIEGKYKDTTKEQTLEEKNRESLKKFLEMKGF